MWKPYMLTFLRLSENFITFEGDNIQIPLCGMLPHLLYRNAIKVRKNISIVILQIL